MKQVENRVKEFREKMGLSQVELARRALMASPNLSSIERGTTCAWPKARKRLAQALNTTEEELFPEHKKGEDVNG